MPPVVTELVVPLRGSKLRAASRKRSADYANAAKVHLLELYSALHHTADVMLLTVVDIIKFVL